MTDDVLSRPRLLAVADSLAMPRPVDGTAFEQTWPALLMKDLPRWLVMVRSRRRNTSVSQATDQRLADDVIDLVPAVVVIQLGIVDCAPRLFRQWQRGLLRRLPEPVSGRVVGFASRHRPALTRFFPKHYVGLDQYRSAMAKIVRTVVECGALPIVLGICDTTEENKRRSWGFTEAIELYNEELADVTSEQGVPLVDFRRHGAQILTEDGIHLNPTGHRIVADQIISRLEMWRS